MTANDYQYARRTAVDDGVLGGVSLITGIPALTRFTLKLNVMVLEVAATYLVDLEAVDLEANGAKNT